MSTPQKPSPQKSKSLQDILKLRSQATFVGREPHLALFRQTLARSPELRDYFIFNVWGQGGVGKSTLLRQFRKLAEESEHTPFATALTNDSETTVPEAMGRLAEQLEQQGHRLPQFAERYKVYRQKKQELESDPEAPQGFSAFVGKAIAKGGLGLAKQIPGSGVVTPFLDEDGISSQAGEWASYVAKKLTNKDEVRLINEPIATLTPLFLQDLGKLAESHQLLLLFDVYERTSPFLDGWLNELLEGRYGELPATLLLAIAGREELDKNRWADWEGAIARLSLDPFTEEEAIQFLHRKGITHEKVIDVILRLSGCLPLLVATLAAESPNDPAQIGDPSGTAVERFLKWVEDPQRRQLALDAALPRTLNRDIIAVLQGEGMLQGEDSADELFNWLRTMPFVEESTEGWVYHDIARSQMLRHKRRLSPQSWADLHGKLVTHYDKLRTDLGLDEPTQWSDTTWQSHSLHHLYHHLCQAPQRQLPLALNQFLAALNADRDLAITWAETITQAGKTEENSEVQAWGERLVEGLTACLDKCYATTVEVFTTLLNHAYITTEWQPIAFAWRGETYRLINRNEEALEDFNRAITLDPKYAWAIAHRGLTYRALDCNEAALKDLNQAIELNPKDAWTIANLGRTYHVMKRYEAALQALTQAIELDLNSTWLSGRGDTYRSMKRYEAALQDFNQAIELNPKDAWAIGHRGRTYHAMKRYEAALQDFNQAIELNPKYDWAIARRGEILLALGRYGEALTDFNQTIALDRTDDWCLYDRALAYQALNQRDRAKTDLEQAIQLAHQQYNENPDNHRNTFNLALYHLAAANLVAGSIQQAWHFYRDALQRQAPSKPIQDAIRDLEDFLHLFHGHEWAMKAKTELGKRVMG